MSVMRTAAWAVAAGLMVAGTGATSAQGYPGRPIRIVTGDTGGSLDLTSRLIAQGISGPLDQAVIVDNRGTTISWEFVFRAPPDGYTLLVIGTPLWIEPLLKQMPYDAARDFAPISMLTSSPHVLVVHPSLPVRSVSELIALARAKSGALNYASGGIGSSPHLAAELFKSMAGANIVRINYKGAGPGLNALIGGEVQLTFVTAGTVAPHLKSDRIRAVAVTTLQPTALFPGMPTVAAALPGYEVVSILGVFAPARTPAAIINRLNQEIVRVVTRADVKEKFFNAGIETVGSSPEELAATMKSEVARMGKVIRDAGIRAE